MGYVSERGDVVRISLSPQAGHEQSGRRPAVLVSPAVYNGKVGLAILCPITTQVKGYPFEVWIPEGLPVTGAILSDQAKSLDWRARQEVIENLFASSREILLPISRKSVMFHHTFLPSPYFG